MAPTTAPSDLATLSEHACFGGTQGFYKHTSTETGLPMRFGVFVPPQAKHGPVPLLFYLAGLTCTEETFAIKGGAQRLAAKHGLMLVTPDTSPRQTRIEGANSAWDFGHGAGFYLDAMAEPWRKHFRMASYVTHELRALVLAQFGGRADRVGVFGHSMGGHGALTLALKNPGLFQSVSAFAPIAAPMQCPWGQKAFTGYLGDDLAAWAQHDANELVKAGARMPHVLIDQGLADPFLAEQLYPDLFEATCLAASQPLTLRRHEGYDHNYYFISTFMAEHIAHHARQLNDPATKEPDAAPATDSQSAPAQAKNPLHGITLETMVTELVAEYGWADLGARIAIRSFNSEPSVASSLAFLRRTPWAREKVEGLYLFMQRERARRARS